MIQRVSCFPKLRRASGAGIEGFRKLRDDEAGERIASALTTFSRPGVAVFGCEAIGIVLVGH